ncbi:MAG: hypothetical protein ACRDZY_11535, partial [Acidimicrobiales bacterium]
SKEEQRRLSKACQAAAAEQQLGLAVRLLQSQGLGLLIEDKETACHLLKVCILPEPVRKYCTLSWLLPDSSRAASGGGCAPAADRNPGPADRGQRGACHLLKVVASLSKPSAVASGSFISAASSLYALQAFSLLLPRVCRGAASLTGDVSWLQGVLRNSQASLKQCLKLVRTLRPFGGGLYALLLASLAERKPERVERVGNVFDAMKADERIAPDEWDLGPWRLLLRSYGR